MKNFVIIILIVSLIAALAASHWDIFGRVISYERLNACESRLELFGVVYKIDLEKAAFIADKTEKMIAYNTRYLPECVTAAARSMLHVIRDIAGRLINYV